MHRPRLTAVVAALSLAGTLSVTDLVSATATVPDREPRSTTTLGVHPATVAPPLRGEAAASRPAGAPVRVPGSLDGLGFDTCTAPEQATMDELRRLSPYWGVGVYIGGESRGCSQPELTRTWIRTQDSKGWRIFPIWNGLQAPTLDRGTSHEVRCSSRPAYPMGGRPEVARRQGVGAADRAVSHARDLGIRRGSTLFLDIEAFDSTVGRCTRAVLNFQSGWNHRLHRQGWKSGFYSSGASGVAALDKARADNPGHYSMPDVLWLAWGNGHADLEGEPYVRDGFWTTQRLHQYDLDHRMRFGSVRLHLDQNAVLVGRGAVPGRRKHTCGVDLDFTRYRSWRFGERSPQVKAVQCLLRRHGLFAGRFSRRFDRDTAHAVGVYQDRRGLRETRRTDARTWVSLLSGGTTPLLKRGSASDRVRFLQRALTAASDLPVTIDGHVDPATATAIRRYQRAVGQHATGVVTDATWRELFRGHH